MSLNFLCCRRWSSYEARLENKGGQPQPWLPAPFALCLAHANPNMHHLFSRQHQCSRGRLQDVFRARRKPRMNVCLIGWQTSRRARRDLFNQWGINWPQFAPHCTQQQIFPSCTKPVQCSEWYKYWEQDPQKSNHAGVRGKVSVCAAWMPLLPPINGALPLTD